MYAINAVHTSIFVSNFEKQTFINLHYICTVDQTSESQQRRVGFFMHLTDWKTHNCFDQRKKKKTLFQTYNNKTMSVMSVNCGARLV